MNSAIKPFVVKAISSPVKGKLSLLGDKSIAHRCIIISSLGIGPVIIENFPANEDCLSTLKIFRKLGIKIAWRKDLCLPVITVIGKGLWGLKEPNDPIFIGESGTTLRLLMGVLSAQSFKTKLVAGRSLSKRPMLRITLPLRLMGATIKARSIIRKARQEEYLPVTIKGGANLKAITYSLPVASAQVKGAILLAGLYAKGLTRIIEPIKTRDHTERMLKLFKADIKVQKNMIILRGGRQLVSPKKIYIPADISSAAFFIVLGAIIPGSDILLKKVNLNPSRMGIIKVLKRMNAKIQFSSLNSRCLGSEPAGDIIVKGSSLKATKIKKEEIPSLIDELPILMVAACFARGKTIFESVEELRVKETDRIKSMSENLAKMGARVEVVKVGKGENIIIEGVKQLNGAKVKSFGDHRTAMSMVIAGLSARGETQIDDISCINKSFPNFINLLRSLNPLSHYPLTHSSRNWKNII